MAQPAPFDSAWLKWAWAAFHAEVLEREIEAFADDLGGDPFLTVRTEYQPKRHAFAIIITGITPLPDHWGLMLGDIAHNFRSALNHLAWDVVRRGKLSPDTLPERHGKDQGGKQIKGPVQNDIAFPIIENPKKFTDAASLALPGARRADIAIIHRYQPCARDRRRRGTQCLTILALHNNIDKHRQLQPLFPLPKGGGIEIVERRNCIVTDKRLFARALPLDVGTELRTVRVRRTSRTGPDPYLEVKPTITAQVVLHGTTWVSWLTNTEAWIFDLLSEFSACPVQYLTVKAGLAAFNKSMSNLP